MTLHAKSLARLCRPVWRRLALPRPALRCRDAAALGHRIDCDLRKQRPLREFEQALWLGVRVLGIFVFVRLVRQRWLDVALSLGVALRQPRVE